MALKLFEILNADKKKTEKTFMIDPLLIKIRQNENIGSIDVYIFAVP